jgi:thioredoxin reductase (NADPH)
MSIRDVIVVGAGPSGLSAAIAAKQRQLDYLVLEQGVLVNSIYRFPPQMVFFTTPELLEIGGLPFVSPYDKPTRTEALKYYRKVADTYDLQIAYGEKVVSIEREAAAEESVEPQRLARRSPRDSPASEGGSGASAVSDESGHEGGTPTLVVTTQSSRGVARARYARNVIMAIGYYDHPVKLGVPGEDLPHVHHYYGEPHPHYRQRVVIVGGGNSAADAALEMYRAGAKVTIVHRAPSLKPTIKYWVRPDIENRIKEGSIAARFNACVTAIRPNSVVIRSTGSAAGRLVGSGPHDEAIVPGSPGQDAASDTAAEACAAGDAGREEEIAADAVYLLTGYRADADLLCRAGVSLTERAAPVYDPETFETNVPGLFVAGGAVAGIDTGTIFIENGRFHGERIIDVIARRLEP